MKKSLLFLMLTALLTACVNTDNIYYLHGYFNKTDSKTAYMISSGQVIDSTSIDSTFHFVFKGLKEKTTPQLVYISDAPTTRGTRNSWNVVWEPGMISMFPEKESDDFSVTGTTSNNLLTEMQKKERELEQKYDELKGQQEEQDKLVDEWYSYLTKNAKKHTDNMFGLICLREISYEQEPAETRKMLDAFKKELHETDIWKQLDEHNVKALATAPGKKYIEFSQTDLNGNVISSKDVMATPGVKYVLIDFWASWCGPCMRELPYLKETYSKYFSKGFQILGVSLDRSRDAWLKAIEDNQMNWIQVSDIKAWENEVAQLYGINSIPANFLVEASTGKIIATGLRGEDLQKKIAELLK